MPNTNTIRVTLQVRNDTAEYWEIRNPILAEGEYGLENDTFLIKIGDGIRDWEHLPYLNKLHSRYFTRQSDGSLTFSSEFAEQINNAIAASGGDAHLVINDDPEELTDPINYDYLQRFVADAIQSAGHLKREIVQELPNSNIDPNTIYMVTNSAGTGYDEYMYIQNTWDRIGDTGDYSGYTLPIANTTTLGGVKAVSDTESEYLNVTQQGFMTLNKVSTSKLFVPTGDTLIIYGGTA